MVFNERARLTYLKWDKLYETEKPFQIFVPLPDDVEDSRTDNLIFESEEEQEILDIRGSESQFSLDDNGFQIVSSGTKMDAFDSKAKIEDVYLPELVELLQRHVAGADRIVFFNWRIRRNDPSKEEGEMININDPLQHLLPITQVHIDTSPFSVAQRVRTQLPEEASELLKNRIRIINVWRPINQPIEDWPLSICDGSSVAHKDLIRCDHIRPQEQAETTFILRNPKQRWYYVHKQRKDEVLLIKNFDSDPDVKANCCPHASFEHRKIRPGAPMRESIEARAMIFTNESTSEKMSGEPSESGSHEAEVRADTAMMLC